MFRKAISLRSKRQTISHAVAPFHLVVPYFVGNCECPRWRKRKRAIPWYPRAGNVIFRADCSQLVPLPVPVELYNDRLIGRAANNRVRRSQQQLRPDSQPASARSSSAQTSIARETLRQAFDRPCCWPPRVPQYATRFQHPTIDRKREIGKSLCRLKTVQAGQRGDDWSWFPNAYTIYRRQVSDGATEGIFEVKIDRIWKVGFYVQEESLRGSDARVIEYTRLWEKTVVKL